MIRLPLPYQDGFCTDTDAADFINPLKYENIYSTSSCKSECQLNFTYERCGCVMFNQKGIYVLECLLQDQNIREKEIEFFDI